jgi:hypothetical protein
MVRFSTIADFIDPFNFFFSLLHEYIKNTFYVLVL